MDAAVVVASTTVDVVPDLMGPDEMAKAKVVPEEIMLRARDARRLVDVRTVVVGADGDVELALDLVAKVVKERLMDPVSR